MMPLILADDTNLFSSGHDISKVPKEVEDDVNKISEWLKVNKLSANIKKTHFIVFTNKNASKPILNISIDGHKIDETDHTKFRGVFIDNKLTWKNHISHITGKLRRGYWGYYQDWQIPRQKYIDYFISYLHLPIYVLL